MFKMAADPNNKPPFDLYHELQCLSSLASFEVGMGID